MRCCVSLALTLTLLPAISACGGEDPSKQRRPADLVTHTGSAPAGERAAVLTAARRAITRDERARVRRGELRDRARKTTCKPRRGERAQADVVVYDCLAVTFEVKATINAPPLASGHPFQLRVDYPSRRFAWCKIVPVGGEGARQRASELVEPDAACGGIAKR